jgi:type III pantothenate kinase
VSPEKLNRSRLLVDVGNSRLKWACFSGGHIGTVSALAHDRDSIPGLHEAWQTQPVPESIWVSNVAGAGIEATIARTTHSLWGILPHFARSEARACGVVNGYSEPRCLGVDRWLALLAAFRANGGPVMVVDAGTAVTVDVVDAQGQHLGGLILPGLHLMFDALMQSTGITPLEGLPGPTLLGSDTSTCISAGVWQAVAGMIERVRRRLWEERRLHPLPILTGSDAEILAVELADRPRVDGNLVLQGLSMMQD